jgi:hypothetical protein
MKLLCALAGIHHNQSMVTGLAITSGSTKGPLMYFDMSLVNELLLIGCGDWNLGPVFQCDKYR